MQYNFTEKQVLEAIKNSGGIITTIQAHLVPIHNSKPDWNTVKKYVDKWESTKAAVEAERQTVLDVAENNIFQEIYKHNSELSKWYLKMKGKDRGYIETQEVINKNPDPLNINLSGETMTAEEFANSGDVEITGGDDK